MTATSLLTPEVGVGIYPGTSAQRSSHAIKSWPRITCKEQIDWACFLSFFVNVGFLFVEKVTNA